MNAKDRTNVQISGKMRNSEVPGSRFNRALQWKKEQSWSTNTALPLSPETA